jgi:hypothetical protein
MKRTSPQLPRLFQSANATHSQFWKAPTPETFRRSRVTRCQLWRLRQNINVFSYLQDVCTSKRVPASAVADEPIALISRLGRSSVAESGNCRARAIPLPTVSLIRGKCKAANALAMHDFADANGKLDNKESFLACGTTNESPRSLFAKVFRYLKDLTLGLSQRGLCPHPTRYKLC